MAADSVQVPTVGNHVTRFILGALLVASVVLALAVFSGLVAGAAWALFQAAWEVFG